MLEQVDQRVLSGAVVQRRDVPEIHEHEPEDDAGHGIRERAERLLHTHEPARGGPQDHPRERQQREQRRDVPEQHVLDHVRGEQVVLAEPVERRRARSERDQRTGEGDQLERPGAPAAGLLRACRKRHR